MVSDKLIFYQNVLGSRRLSNFFWAVVTITGGIGFPDNSMTIFYEIYDTPTNLAFRNKFRIINHT